MKPVCVVLALCALAMAGCGAAPPRSAGDRAAIVAAADWNSAREVRIELKDSGFSPRELRLEAGRPYRLTLLNLGVNHHYFNAPEFYASIAAYKANVPRYAEIRADQFSSFELYAAGGTMELWFVPLDKGRYRAHCHLGNHAEMGVEGVLIIE